MLKSWRFGEIRHTTVLHQYRAYSGLSSKAT